MANQTGRNMYVAFKEEGTFNTEPSPLTGAEKLRLSSSPGLVMARATVLPNEVRSDMLTPMGRLGSRSVGGSYNCDLTVNTLDSLLEALFRGTWTAAVAITETEMTSITTTTDTIVASAGSWITEGVRVGDLVRLTDHSTAANNNINLRVTAVSATTITVPANSLTTDSSPDSAFTLTILKKLVNPSTPSKKSFWFEEYYQDIDQSVCFGGCRVTGMTLRGAPDGMATMEVRLAGAGQTVYDNANSPVYTSPTTTTTVGLVFSDAKIGLDGTDLVIATGFELALNIGGATQPVVGTDYSPDVFDEEMTGTGQLSLIRQDLDYLEAFDAETEYELSVLLQEPSGTPRKAFSLYVPRIKFTSNDAPKGGAGAMIETVPFMVGLQESASGYDQTMALICTDTAT